MASENIAADRAQRARAWSRWGIRQQLTFAAAMAVAVPFFLGIFVLASSLHLSLEASLVNATRAEADRLVLDAEQRGPTVVEIPGTFSEGFTAQVTDGQGRLVATWSRNATTPMASIVVPPGSSDVSGQQLWYLPGDQSSAPLVVGVGFSYRGDPYVMLVGTSQQRQEDFVTKMVQYLFIAMPGLVLLSAMGAYWLVSRALKPVSEITARVRGISESNLSERVPVPRTGDELVTLATTMNGMLSRLDAARRAKEAFVADASHELRSPLTTLAGALELADTHDPQTLDELLALMRTETGRLQDLVSDMIFISKSDDRGLRLSLHEVDLDDLMDAEVARLRSSGVVVERAIVATRITGDRDKLLHLLRNLDDNARRHAASTVRLSLEPLPDGGARISVEDDGAGIAAADRDRVFDRFVRLDESRSRDSGGSGLGLAIVNEVARAHGGTVHVEESATLGGAAFIVTLPAAGPRTASVADDAIARTARPAEESA